MADRQSEYTGPSMLEVLLLVLVIAGAVAGGLYAFGILPPDSETRDLVLSPRVAQQTIPQNPTPSSTSLPTPQPTPSLIRAEEQTEEPTPLATPAPTPSPTGTQAQTPEATLTPTATQTTAATAVPAAATASTPAVAPSATLAPTATATPAPPFDGSFSLTLEQPLGETYAGKVISFKIGEFTANEAATWQQGQTNELDLAASSSLAVPGPSSSELAKGVFQSPAGSLLASPLMQPAPPSVFQGTATVDGVLAAEGTIVTALVDDNAVAIASVVPRPAIPDSLSEAGDYFSPLGATLRRVWRYDTPVQFWFFYDPRTAFAATNTLTEVQSGEIVWIDLSDAAEFKGINLFQGWNLVALP